MTTTPNEQPMPDPNVPNVQTHRHGRRRGRWARRFSMAITGFIVTAALAVFLAPTMLSSSLGNRFILSYVNDAIPGTLHAKSISLAWFSGQSAQGLKLDDPDGNPVIEVGSFQAGDASLLSLIRGSAELGIIHVANLTGRIKQYEDGTNSLTRALQKPQQPARPGSPGSGMTATPQPLTIPKDLRFRAELDGGRLVYDPLDAMPIELLDLAASGEVLYTQHATLKLTTKTQQGNTQGKIDGTIKILNLFDAQGALAPTRAEIDAQVNLSNIPIVAADRLLNQEGRLVALLGPILNTAQVIAKGNANQCTATVWANSQNLKVLLGVELDPQRIVVNPESELRLTVVPHAWQAITHTLQATTPTTLKKEFPVTVSFTQFAIDRASKDALDPSTADCEIELQIGDMLLDAKDKRVGQLALRGTKGKFTFNGKQNKGGIELQAIAEQNGLPGKLKLQITAKDAFDDQGRFNRAGIDAAVNGSATQIPVGIIDQLLNADGLIAAAIGPILETHIDGKLTPSPTGLFADSKFTITAAAQNLEASFKGEFKDNQLVIEPQSTATLRILPSVLPQIAHWLNADPDQTRMLTLAQTVKAKLLVEKLNVSLKEITKPVIDVRLQASIDRIEPAGDPRWAGAAVKDVAILVTSEHQGAPINLSLAAVLTHHDQTAAIRANAELENTHTQNPSFKATALVEAMPVSLIDTVTNSDGQFTTWLGKRIDKAIVQATGSAAQGLDITARIDADAINGILGAQYTAKNRLVTLRKGSWVQYQLTPNAFADWINTRSASPPTRGATTPRMTLEKTFTIKAVVQEAQAALNPPPTTDADPPTKNAPPFDPATVKLAVSLINDQTTLRWGKQAVHLNKLNAAVRTQNLSESLELLLKLDLQQPNAAPGQPNTGQLLSRTEITGLYTPSGLDAANATIKSTTKAQDLPLDLIDQLMGWDGAVASLLGNQASLSLQVQTAPNQPGRIDLTADSDASQLQVAAAIENNQLTLLRDAQATLTVTPALSRQWLKRVHPFLNDAAASKQPIKLTVHSNGFALPLENFSIQQVQATAVLDLGTIAFSNTGFLNELRKALRRDTGSYPVSTFSPANLTLDNGVVAFQDLAMRMDNLDLNFRGRVEQTRGGRLDMTMSLSAETMAKAFGLRDALEPGYQFDIPIGGTVQNPQADLGAIIGEAARLAARSQLKKHVGGVEGEVAEQVLDLILGGNKNKNNQQNNQRQ